jgi:hypothetical protein
MKNIIIKNFVFIGSIILFFIKKIKGSKYNKHSYIYIINLFGK